LEKNQPLSCKGVDSSQETDMSGLAKKARDAMRSKISRLMRSAEKVDASSFTPAEPLNADVKTGMRPVSRRQFKRGGKVAKMEGGACKPRADRMARKSGGSAKATPNNIINRDVKEANEEREGKKHVGGMKKGGKAEHPDVAKDKAIVAKAVHKHERGKHPGSKFDQTGHWRHAAGAEGSAAAASAAAGRDAGRRRERLQRMETVAGSEARRVGQAHSAASAAEQARGGLDGSTQGARPKGGRLARKTAAGPRRKAR
jgi:hypothetical protein